MGNKEHTMEIENSRKGGFGGSDAAMFLRIAKRGSVDGLSRTDSIRIAVAMGLREYKSIEPTPAMLLGHNFEDYFAQDVNVQEFWEREKKLELASEWQPKNFKVFAHADFYCNTEGSGSDVMELKCSEAATEVVMDRAMPQLQWYYMLGVTYVKLVHCTPNVDVPLGFAEDSEIFANVEQVMIEKDPETVELLGIGVQILDEAISDGWQPEIDDTLTESELDEEILMKLHLLQANKETIDMLTAKSEELKAEILAYMDEKGVAVVDGVDYTLTKVNATETRSFDSAKFFKAHPELVTERDQFQKVSQRKAYVTLKAKK